MCSKFLISYILESCAESRVKQFKGPSYKYFTPQYKFTKIVFHNARTIQPDTCIGLHFSLSLGQQYRHFILHPHKVKKGLAIYCMYYSQVIVSILSKFLTECYYTFNYKDHWDPGIFISYTLLY